MFSLLLIDDNPDDRSLIIRELSREFSDLQAEEIIDLESFNQALAIGKFQMVITDYQIGWTDGLTVLEEVKSRYPDCPVIMFTGSGNQEIAVEAMKTGLDDYIIKSPKHFSRLPMAVRSAWQRIQESTKRQQIEAALTLEHAKYKLENQRLRAVLDLLPIGVFIADSHGQILEANPAARTIWGQDLPLANEISEYEEYKGWWVSTGERITGDEWALVRALKRGESSIGEEIEIEAFDGQRKTILNSAVPIRDETGAIINAVVVNVDITERKQVELEREQFRAREQAHTLMRESEERYRQIVELCPDAIFIQNGEQIVFANSAALKLFGASTPQELIGRSILEQVHPDYQQVVKQRMQWLNKGEQTELMEQKWQKLDGTLIDIEVMANSIIYSNQSAAQVVARDISSRKRAEEEILKALTREKELNDIKSRVITTISHEYRTPLTTIIMSAELLENYPHKLSEEKKLTHIGRIRNSAKYLAQLVNDVVTIGDAQAEKIEFHPTPVNLEKLCREITEQMNSESRTGLANRSMPTNIIFSSHGDCQNAYLDEKLLKYILTNLLSNAIKYSLEGGTILFNLECIHSIVRFSIQDQGIGIPAEDIPRLFEAFHRAKNVGTIRGTGLGLAIVKKCVDLHGGQIRVESVVNQGTIFTVTLPLTHGV